MKKLLLLTSFLFTLTFYAQNNPDFYLAPNGVTCLCPEADFGDTGTLTINGEAKILTKRTEAELRDLAINTIDDSQIALTCTSGITNMNDLFNGFNGNISSFNQNLEHWDVSQVTDMANMFIYASSFNQALNNWDVGQVTSMRQMFAAASAFNQPLDNWDVSNVSNMRSMFVFASSFNLPLNSWDVSNVSNMRFMFYDALVFNQDISSWNFNQDLVLNQFLDNSSLSSSNYDALLQSFDNQNLINLALGADNIAYCDEQTRSNLIDDKGWTIIGDILGQCGDVFNPSTTPFVTTWTVQDDLSIAIYTFNAFNYDFTVDWGDGEIDQNVTADITHNYATPGTYAVSIIGVFPYFKTCENATDSSVCDNAPKLSSIESWGDQEWRTMNGSFKSANFNINTAQTPDLSNVTNMYRTFINATGFNQNINNWDVSQITNMTGTFRDASNFNQPLDSWDVSQVTNMSFMFYGAESFDRPLDLWNVSQVSDMYAMFSSATSFNQPLDNWDVGNVSNMEFMFSEAISFDQFLDSWNVSNVSSMKDMFSSATSFNQPLNSWNVSNVSNMRSMFSSATSFSQPLDSWDVSQVTSMDNMFDGAISFDQPLDNWNVSNVSNMRSMFLDATSFNQSLNSWNVSNVSNMEGMFFFAASFNQTLDNWDVGNVSNMRNMFVFASSFNLPLNNWDVSNVNNMFLMFYNASSFSQPLNNWDVSNVTDMGSMFYGAESFDQPLDSWDVSNVTNMDSMFSDALVFNQDLSGWCVQQIPSEPFEFADNSALQDDFFPNWGAECNLSTTNPDAIGFDILIYPNPSNSKVFIENDGQVILSKIKLIDMLGRDIKTFSASQITNGLDVSGVDAGNYFVQFTTGDGQHFVKRLIVN
jgi:surface protein